MKSKNKLLYRPVLYVLGVICGIAVFSTFFLFWANAFSVTGISDLLPDAWSSKNYTRTQFAAQHKHIALQSQDGPLYVAQIVAGPFDLHRKYLSMEGPFINWRCNIASLVASKKIQLPESKVCFTETSAQQTATQSQNTGRPRIKGLVRLSGHPRQLYWLKGIELTVFDEKDKQLPTAEFICHLNLNVDPLFRNRVFSSGQPCRGSRLITLTQGQTKFFFPDGYAIPLASDERLMFDFQAANRTTFNHRNIKHLCKLYFLKDSEAARPINALQWDCPFLTVMLHKTAMSHLPSSMSHCEMGSCCINYMSGSAAPNSRGRSVYSDSARGASISGHWVVPTGTHTFHAPYYAPSMATDFTSCPRTIHAAWCHVHPLCTEASLIERTGGKSSNAQRKKLFTVHIKTRTKPGLEIMNIENICSVPGIPLAGTSSGKQYELEAVYCNTTGAPADSMVTMGIFATNEKFRKPNWTVLVPVWHALAL